MDTLQINADTINRQYLDYQLNEQLSQEKFKTRDKTITKQVWTFVTLISIFVALVLWYLHFPNWFCLVLVPCLCYAYYYFKPMNRVNEFEDQFNESLDTWFDSIKYYSTISPDTYKQLDKYIKIFNYELGLYFKNNTSNDFTNYLAKEFDTVDDYHISILTHLEDMRNIILKTFDSFRLCMSNTHLLERHRSLGLELEKILNTILTEILFNIQWNLTQKHKDTIAEHYNPLSLYELH